MVGVGELIASAVVKQITSRLIKIVGDEISLQWKFKGEVDKMTKKMKYLAAVMHDADDKVRRGGRHGETVGFWLLKLKSVSYDLQDLLDDLETKNHEAKLKVFFSRNNQAYQWITRPHNLEKVGKRIEEVKNEGKTFNLDPEARVEQSRKKETFSAISDGGTSTGMQGRSAENEKAIKLILQSRANERMSIIPIVGLGGIGKTTLARSVFADKRLNIFDIKAWVHVSDKFDLHKIVRAIIRSVDTNINLDSNDLEFLHNILRGKSAGKRYLIVLDDFWEEDGDNLEELKQMLQHGSHGSRIIVTTRKQSVVKTMSTGDLAHQRVILPVHESDQINLGALPTDDCWELMKIRAFGPDDDQIPLKQIGYEITSKCGGIPLVANAFGKVMSENKSIESWQDIKVRMVDLGLRGEHQKDTLESLKLSYYFMKMEFKICFAYLATFPKGFVIDPNRLIQQWKALGYIYSEHDGKGCIRYLLGMSFLQISGSPSVSLCPLHASSSQELTMHDLVHDLASVIIGEEFFLLDANATGPRTWEKTIHCRHAELIHYRNQSNVFDHLPRKLRSLHVRDTQKWQLPPKAFSRSKYMRVLDLACSVGKLSEGQSTSSNISLPRSIKQMKLLRYLDATGLPVSSLSKSFDTLQHMETLIMSNSSLEALPDNVCSLYNLCYLDLSGNRSLNKLPASLGKLSKLFFLNLSGCYVLQEVPTSICQLTCLQHLDMSECRAIQNLPDNLDELSKLSFLNLSGCSVLQEVPKSICQLTCLQHLDMSECRAIQNLPNKFGSLPNTLFLNLSDCSKLTKLPDNVNLDSLEHLDLSSCHELENLPQDFGNLQSLVFLSLSNCYMVSVLPESFCKLVHLKDLDLSDCHGLQKLPECFGNISELESLNLTSCSKLQVLPNSFFKLFKLRHLNLSYCMRLETLPTSLGDLKLELLDISAANFKDLPDSIYSMTTLTQPDVSSAQPKVFEKACDIRKHLNLAEKIKHIVHQIDNKGCSSIVVELAQLTCQQLQVSKLQNVKDPEDAERARLRDKADLQMLYLSWGLQGEEDIYVLERLVPPRTLEHFILDGYMSMDFPNWMSQISTYLPSLTYLFLCNLGTCVNLPPFGQLQNLRSLFMDNIPNVTRIGKEFYGEGGTCRKLRSIKLKSMGNLVEWWTTQSGEENEESLIPNLHKLQIIDCPKLKFLPYPPRSMFWYLVVLPIGGFGVLSSSVPPFRMVIKNCNFSPYKWDRLQHLPTLEILRVGPCNGLRVLPESIRCLTSLTKLHLWSLKDLETLPEWMGNLTSLEHIIIKDCPVVTSLPESMKYLAALRKLWLDECEGLDVLPEWLGQLISLHEFYIVRCPNMTRLPESIHNLAALKNGKFTPDKWDRIQHLPTLEIFVVDSCNSLRAFPEVFRCLTSLKKLYLCSLKDLERLPEWLGNLTSLEHISIKDCPVVTSLPASMKYLTALRELWLDQCEGLDVLPEWMGQLISLQEFNIICCPNMKRLPESIKNLTALKKLYIWGCPSLVERCQGEDAHRISHIPTVTLNDVPWSTPGSMRDEVEVKTATWIAEMEKLNDQETKNDSCPDAEPCSDSEEAGDL